MPTAHPLRGITSTALTYEETPERGWYFVQLAGGRDEPLALGYILRVPVYPYGYTAWGLGRTAPLHGPDGKVQHFADRASAGFELARELHGAQGWTRFEVTFTHPDSARTFGARVTIYNGDPDRDEAIRAVIATRELANPGRAARVALHTVRESARNPAGRAPTAADPECGDARCPYRDLHPRRPWIPEYAPTLPAQFRGPAWLATHRHAATDDGSI